MAGTLNLSFSCVAHKFIRLIKSIQSEWLLMQSRREI